jgi:hypothetical protein
VALWCRENNEALFQASLKRRQDLPPNKMDSVYDIIM